MNACSSRNAPYVICQILVVAPIIMVGDSTTKMVIMMVGRDVVTVSVEMNPNIVGPMEPVLTAAGTAIIRSVGMKMPPPSKTKWEEVLDFSRTEKNHKGKCLV